MNIDELDSQLSAMFDDELPAPECELLARRLARDEALKARWGRYAAIGAAIRMERGVRLHGHVADRVSTAIAAEPAVLAGSAGRVARQLASPMRRWWQPIAGSAVAAGVAAAAILVLRAGPAVAPLAAQVVASVPRPLAVRVADRPAAPDSYTVPPSVESSSFAPPVELADFVVAHSEFTMPLLRRSALSALVAAESADPADASAPESSGRGSQDSGNPHAAHAR